MKRLFLLFSHALTEAKEQDARVSLDVEAFEKLPDELHTLWSNIPPQPPHVMWLKKRLMAK